jgi:hypothetical protein
MDFIATWFKKHKDLELVIDHYEVLLLGTPVMGSFPASFFFP